MDRKFKRDFPLSPFYQICSLKSIFSQIRRDVLKKMALTYQEAKPKDYVDHVEKTTFAEIIDMWYLDAVVPRLPTADIRDGFKLSKYTVQN